MAYKVRSVLELAKYQPGDKPYWVITRSIGREPVISEEDAWLFSECIHPKTPYQYGILSCLWPSKAKLPRLHASDFALVLELLTSEFVTEEFEVAHVVHCTNTGEFIYQNITGEEWMPESLLFDTKDTAQKELKRIKKLIAKWAKPKA